jgi:hypothetical protein
VVVEKQHDALGVSPLLEFVGIGVLEPDEAESGTQSLFKFEFTYTVLIKRLKSISSAAVYMRKRKLLKSIGAASAIGGFTTVAQAGKSRTESRSLTKSEIRKFKNSRPVQNLLNKINASFELSGPETTKLTVIGTPEEHRMVHDGIALIRGVRLETNGGVIGITLQDGEAHEAVIVQSKKLNRREAGVNREISVDTNATTDGVDGAMVVAGSNSSAYVRGATPDEKTAMDDLSDEEITKYTILEKGGNRYYSFLTGESKATYVVDQQTREVVSRNAPQSTVSDEIDSGTTQSTTSNLEGSTEIDVGTSQVIPSSCEGLSFAVCTYDLTDLGIYCGLAAQACSYSVGAGVVGLVACAAAILTLCGGRIILATISGACADVAGCVADYCDQNPFACPGSFTPIPV